MVYPTYLVLSCKFSFYINNGRGESKNVIFDKFGLQSENKIHAENVTFACRGRQKFYLAYNLLFSSQ